LQLLYVNGEIAPFIRTAFVDDARYCVIGIKERSPRHARCQLLRDFDKLHAALDGEGTDKPGLMLSGSPGAQPGYPTAVIGSPVAIACDTGSSSKNSVSGI
jgi:hypothetical protein